MSSWLICICIYSWCIYYRCRDSCCYFEVWVRDSCNYFDVWIRDTCVYLYICHAYATGVVTNIVSSWLVQFVTHTVTSLRCKFHRCRDSCNYFDVWVRDSYVYLCIFAMHTQQMSWRTNSLFRYSYSLWLIWLQQMSWLMILFRRMSLWLMCICIYSQSIYNRCCDSCNYLDEWVRDTYV